MSVGYWLVTGGCGFIGSSLCARLIAEGRRVRVLDNLSVGKAEALPAGAELMVGDIRDPAAAMAAAAGADAVVHLAANTGVMPSIENPRLDCESNVIGVLNVLEAARAHGVKHFVFASSGAPLGEQTPPLHEEMAAHPMSPYGASKLAGEGYCSAYWHSFGLATVALRFGNVYGVGSGHKNSVIAKFIGRALAGEVLEVHGDGTQTRDFIYLGDLLEAVIRAGTRTGLGGEVIQIATGTERTVNEIAERVAKLVKARTGKVVSLSYGSGRPGEMKRNFADISKARRLLDFEPAMTIEKGLEATLDYFLAR